MKFGLFSTAQALDRTPAEAIQETIDMAVQADRLGFDSFWLAEHHFSEYGTVGSPLLLAAAIAQKTQNIRIGMAVLVLPLYHPLRVAEEVALLDVMSDGRIEIGFGRGYQPNEFKGFRLDMAEAQERTDEIIEIMQLAWKGEPFSYQGKFFEVDDVQVRPDVVQKPHPPVYQAAITPDSFRRAGELGRQVMSAPAWTPNEVVAEMYSSYAEARRQAGGSAEFPFPCMRELYIGDDEQDAYATPEKYAMQFKDLFVTLIPGANEKVAKSFEAWEAFGDMAQALSYDTAHATEIYRTPEGAAEEIRKLRDLGVTETILWPSFGGFRRDLVERSVERFGTEVMPNLRAEFAETTTDSKGSARTAPEPTVAQS